jgi:hypothetical protein
MDLGQSFLVRNQCAPGCLNLHASGLHTETVNITFSFIKTPNRSTKHRAPPTERAWKRPRSVKRRTVQRNGLGPWPVQRNGLGVALQSNAEGGGGRALRSNATSGPCPSDGTGLESGPFSETPNPCEACPCEACEACLHVDIGIIVI